jgi:hypothetical protein
MLGWLALEQPWGASVSPLDDLIEHDLDGFDECVCGPTLWFREDGVRAVATHHSLDGRELSE